MEKKHLFSILAFLFSVLALSLFDEKAGFAYAMWIFSINVLLNFAYYCCKPDKEEL